MTPIFFVENSFRRNFLNGMNGFLEKTIFQYLEASMYFSFVVIKTLGYYVIVNSFNRNLKFRIVTKRKILNPFIRLTSRNYFFDEKNFRHEVFDMGRVRLSFGGKNLAY